jgi:hypothetical protein
MWVAGEHLPVRSVDEIEREDAERDRLAREHSASAVAQSVSRTGWWWLGE